ncbi:YoaK family protein [Kitasatospora sp. NPDC089509]|uniref:YoaK family protein n=1 Tax=Kitasatospora sp. NPDC089509 TaxID=3364079 RepID=UPI003829A08F
MLRHDPLPVALVALTVMTGMLDAISFLGLGRVFLAMMTGNAIFLGLSVSGVAGFSTLRLLLAFVCFTAGIVVGTRAGRVAERRARRHWFFCAMAVEMLVLAVAAGLAFLVPATDPATRTSIIALLALAMGARCATVRRLAVPDLPVTVGLTGTLIALVQDSPLTGGTDELALRKTGVVVAMPLGAALGGLLMTAFGLGWSLLAALGLVLLVTTGVWWHPAGPARRG